MAHFFISLPHLFKRNSDVLLDVISQFYCLLTSFSALASTLIAKLSLSAMEEHFKAFLYIKHFK